MTEGISDKIVANDDCCYYPATLSERLSAFVTQALVETVDAVPIFLERDNRRQFTSKYQKILRKIRTGKTQPALEEVWDFASGLMFVAGNLWANPIVMLFLLGHYGHVADLLLSVPNDIVSVQRRLAMAGTLSTVALPLDRTRLFEKIKADLQDLHFDASVVQNTAERYAHDLPPEREDRSIWSINASEYAAFLSRWHRIIADGVNCCNATVAQCEAISCGSQGAQIMERHAASLIEAAVRSEKYSLKGAETEHV